jgi:protein translocase SecG subunit
MKSSLIVALILIGVVFMISVLLMSPKGWLGFGIGGAGGSNEYGSKKSIEFTLKRVAMIAGIAFVVVATAIPLLGK